jgi:hypothetical protein
MLVIYALGDSESRRPSPVLRHHRSYNFFAPSGVASSRGFKAGNWSKRALLQFIIEYRPVIVPKSISSAMGSGSSSGGGLCGSSLSNEVVQCMTGCGDGEDNG